MDIGGFVELFAQGLVNSLDLFIHPQYISSNGPMGLNLGLIALIIGIIGVFALLVIIQNWYKKIQEKRDLDAQLDTEDEDDT